MATTDFHFSFWYLKKSLNSCYITTWLAWMYSCKSTVYLKQFHYISKNSISNLIRNTSWLSLAMSNQKFLRNAVIYWWINVSRICGSDKYQQLRFYSSSFRNTYVYYICKLLFFQHFNLDSWRIFWSYNFTIKSCVLLTCHNRIKIGLHIFICQQY